MPEYYGAVSAHIPVRNDIMCLVIEYDTILKYFYKSGAVVFCSLYHDLLCQLQFHIQGASKERTAGTHGQCTRIKGMLNGSERRCFGYRTPFGSRGILSFCQTVNSVVEQHYVDVYVSADGMDQMVTSNSQGVSITCHLPNGKSRICNLNTRGNGSGPSVDTMETVCFHIIGKT